MADINKDQSSTNQKQQPDNAGLQNKISNKQNPADVDKASASGKTSNASDGGDQRSNVSSGGSIDRQSVGEIGTKKQKEKNQILNEQVKEPKEKNEH